MTSQKSKGQNRVKMIAVIAIGGFLAIAYWNYYFGEKETVGECLDRVAGEMAKREGGRRANGKDLDRYYNELKGRCESR
jgi:hypothetical protein